MVDSVKFSLCFYMPARLLILTHAIWKTVVNKGAENHPQGSVQSEMHGVKNSVRIPLTQGGRENDTAAGIVCFLSIHSLFHAPGG
jgi:hypothetical protein